MLGLENPNLDIEIINTMILFGSFIISLFIAFFGGKWRAKVELEKSKHNRLQDLEIDYIIEYWKKQIEFSSNLSLCILFFDENCGKDDEIIKKKADEKIEFISNQNRNIVNFYNSIALFIPPNTENYFDRINDISLGIVSNLIVANSILSSSEAEKYMTHASQMYFGKYKPANKELFDNLKNNLYLNPQKEKSLTKGS